MAGDNVAYDEDGGVGRRNIMMHSFYHLVRGEDVEEEAEELLEVEFQYSRLASQEDARRRVRVRCCLS